MERNGRSSYSLTRGRAVSPVVSNYFGLPPTQESSISRSASVFGNRSHKSEERRDGDGLFFWGKKLNHTYGFFGETEPLDGPPGMDGGEDNGKRIEDEEEGDEQQQQEEEEEEDEDEDGDDSDDDDDDEEEDEIDIFGHR